MRRPDKHYNLLREHVECMLALVFELQCYAIYLQSTPHVFGALLAKASDPTTADNILQRLKTEWAAILAMEARKESRVLLHKLCPHVEWQVTRELHSFLCSKSYNIDDDLLALLSGWFPRLSGSCNVEQIFQSMERSLKQSGCSNGASMASLMSVGIRATSKRLCCESNVRTVHLQHDDYEGQEIRSFKDRIWRPCNASPSFLVSRNRQTVYVF